MRFTRELRSYGAVALSGSSLRSVVGVVFLKSARERDPITLVAYSRARVLGHWLPHDSSSGDQHALSVASDFGPPHARAGEWLARTGRAHVHPTTHSPDGKRPSSCKYLVCSYTLPLAKLPGIGFTHTCDLCLLITPMGLPQPWHRTRSSLAPYDNKAASPTALLAVAARTPAPSLKEKIYRPSRNRRSRRAIEVMV